MRIHYGCFIPAERDQYQLGSLSHTINNRAIGYYELPAWPDVPPPSDVRNVEMPKPAATVSMKGKKVSFASSFGDIKLTV